jgi:hypothetical protein
MRTQKDCAGDCPEGVGLEQPPARPADLRGRLATPNRDPSGQKYAIDDVNDAVGLHDIGY